MDRYRLKDASGGSVPSTRQLTNTSVGSSGPRRRRVPGSPGARAPAEAEATPVNRSKTVRPRFRSFILFSLSRVGQGSRAAAACTLCATPFDVAEVDARAGAMPSQQQNAFSMAQRRWALKMARFCHPRSPCPSSRVAQCETSYRSRIDKSRKRSHSGLHVGRRAEQRERNSRRTGQEAGVGTRHRCLPLAARPEMPHLRPDPARRGPAEPGRAAAAPNAAPPGARKMPSKRAQDRRARDTGRHCPRRLPRMARAATRCAMARASASQAGRPAPRAARRSAMAMPGSPSTRPNAPGAGPLPPPPSKEKPTGSPPAAFGARSQETAELRSGRAFARPTPAAQIAPSKPMTPATPCASPRSRRKRRGYSLRSEAG